ncbi:hypothetical protein FB567DRAFT_542242 [Paraphoma chrysanthemicola]|uniref:Amidohydrolase-related domain-containing protein n=1 Tax=Paraphoma chrysanthemicola TaxID=798071 RepID=A0A8K0QR83_9PLEO|nr:hypothetical protein FB567DRAFT_542242 [Paraphoma chrysanthemicola]
MDNEKTFDFGAQPPPYDGRQSRYFLAPRRRRARLALLSAVVFLSLVLLRHNILAEDLGAFAQRDVFWKGLETCRKTSRHKNNVQHSLQPRVNPRWNVKLGQNGTIILQNATLFDGETILHDTVDIVFDKGLITSISKSGETHIHTDNTQVYNLQGRFVTPGLVDIHSHHLEMPLSHVTANQDVNEKPHLGPITPFVRAIDGFKPYDLAIRIIASGGVTTSLNLPGSGNIIGGQAYLIKNLPNPGENAEPIVEDLLFDHGLPIGSRQRYLKMACGENPKYLYGHSRLGNAWLLRQHLEKARKLKLEQESWCERAESFEKGSDIFIKGASKFISAHGQLQDSFEFGATIALLRGEFNINIHCYEPEDLERMIDVLHEFGVHPNAFHHALEAWQIPEFLKQQERNITIATFAENALFKYEAYGANLRGPKILDDHGVRVVLKSDHTGEGNNARYLLDQASVSHSYGLPELKALQSVTSAAAYSIQQDHRIGYVRTGYDADLAVWDSHPLAVGATPLQVWIDGRNVLDADQRLEKTATTAIPSNLAVPGVHAVASKVYKHDVCTRVKSVDDILVFTGIKDAFLHDVLFDTTGADNDHVVVVSAGKVICFDRLSVCDAAHKLSNATNIPLRNGYITAGLIAFGNNVGILDIPSEPSTGDGTSSASNVLDIKNVHFAKHGVHFGSRSFSRARLGGVTRTITAPNFGGGVLQGVSAGLRTSENATILNGGVWKDEVALHFHIGQDTKNADTPTISSGIERLYQIISDNALAPSSNTSNVYNRAATGVLPVVVHTNHPDDIAQVILLKRAFPLVRFVVYGGHGAHRVASELAEADVPVILAPHRGAPDTWEKQHTLPGPPLSASPAQILLDAGVLVALAVKGDSKIHGLAREAAWAAKWAALSDRQAIGLVSWNFDSILRLSASDVAVEGYFRHDWVLWEGNPVKGEGSVVLSVDSDRIVGDCLPNVEGAVL